ncbi:MAG TPA: DEAD/DEAH box helicase [Acidimicrobiia bacterium]|nr:DEAD/DEAH box helicase [Acidimicrobiia bacterium]
MLVAHALWSPGRGFCLWAEDSRLAGRPRQDDDYDDAFGLRRHSFALAADGLGAFLGLGADAVARATAVRLTLLLPTDGGRPLPAGAVRAAATNRRSRAALGLRPWAVPALRVAPGDALEALLSRGRSAGTPERNGDSVITSASWAWSMAVAEEALELAARGQAVPAVLRVADGRSEARWLPAPAAADGDRLRALVAGIPLVCRAEIAGRSEQPVGTPEELLTGALGDLLDAAVRSSLASRRLASSPSGRRSKKLAAAERFLTALTANDATIPIDPDDGDHLEELQAVLREWRRSGLPTAGPLRTCFRLVPPAEPDDEGASDEPWRVEILLQSTEDPSLLVPAEDVWHDGPALQSLRESVANPEAHLLADLGRASRLWPGLEVALADANPSEVVLDAAGGQRFLGDAAPLLEQAGFGILVPPWWKQRTRLGLRLRARPRPVSAGSDGPGIGLAGLCDYRFEIAVGDATLTIQELRNLAELKAPLVRVRGQWVELRAGDVERALAVLTGPRRAARAGAAVATIDDEEDLAAGAMTAGDILRIGLGLAPPPTAELPVVEVVGEGWLGALLGTDGDGADQGIEPRKTPAGFDGTLRPYQERGLAWLWFLHRHGLGACLADDMGLGKTAQLLALMVAEREDGDSDRSGDDLRPNPTLLVCPMSLVGNWQRETARFAPGLVVYVHHGTSRTKAALAKAVGHADLVITTYSLLARDRDLLAKFTWGRLALDEAQNVKNPNSLAGRAARALPTAGRVALTGTPVENRLLELWSLMDILNPGLLGSEHTFRERFAVPIERYGDETAAATLQRLTGPFVLRRLKTDRSIIADLPEKIEMHVLCNLTREQASLYQAVVDDMLDRIEKAKSGIERMGVISGSMMKLKQVCNHPAHFLRDGSRLDAARSGKLARLEEILEEIFAAGERALVFTQFAEMGSLLQTHLSEQVGIDLPFLSGGVARRRREEMVDAFQADGGPPVLILSLKAGGVGLNLTAANHVVHYDRWWNPAVEDQATDRVFRIGQQRNVQVRKFVCVGTVEERIDAMIESKRELAERIVGTGEARLTDLNLAQLRELVALSEDAVAEA